MPGKQQVPAPQDPSFQTLILRVRAGDEAAATTLVREYEPEIRRAIRVRLTDPRLRRTLDSMDICQSVMGRFFALIRADQFDFNNPTDLLRLLVRMAQNKLRDHIRYQYAERRDARKITPGSSAVLPNVAGAGENPSSIVANQELLEAVRGQLSREELYLADQRAEGREWADLAAELGEKPDAVRRRLTRALDRAFKQLGLADPGSGD